MLRQHEIQIRVRYNETDPMGVLHHAQYFTYFEMGRTELLRQRGITYRTTVRRVTRAKIEHDYELLRDGERLASGTVVLGVVDRQGRVREVPEWLRHQDD